MFTVWNISAGREKLVTLSLDDLLSHSWEIFVTDKMVVFRDYDALSAHDIKGNNKLVYIHVYWLIFIFTLFTVQQYFDIFLMYC